MKEKFSILVILAILIVPMVCYSLFMTPNKSGQVQAATGKPTVVAFSTKMCSECLKLKPTLADAERKYKYKVNFDHVDANMTDTDSQMKVKKYNVKVVPTLVFVDKKGDVKAITTGAIPKNTLEHNIEEIME